MEYKEPEEKRELSKQLKDKWVGKKGKEKVSYKNRMIRLVPQL